jgi:hypothetical protein
MIQLLDRYSIQNFEYSSTRKSAKIHRYFEYRLLDEIPIPKLSLKKLGKFIVPRKIPSKNTNVNVISALPVEKVTMS